MPPLYEAMSYFQQEQLSAVVSLRVNNILAIRTERIWEHFYDDTGATTF